MLGCDCCSISSFVYVIGVFTIASKVVPFVLKKFKGNNISSLQYWRILLCKDGAKNNTVERASTSIGKFAEKDYNELFRNDLVQLQIIIGKKKFLLGDEPTAVDCTALGQFAFGYYVVPSTRYYFHDLLESSEFAPLKEYCERVKTRIFGDAFRDN